VLRPKPAGAYPARMTGRRTLFIHIGHGEPGLARTPQCRFCQIEVQPNGSKIINRAVPRYSRPPKSGAKPGVNPVFFAASVDALARAKSPWLDKAKIAAWFDPPHLPHAKRADPESNTGSMSLTKLFINWRRPPPSGDRGAEHQKKAQQVP